MGAVRPLLTGAAILAASDLETIDLEVPEWGGTIRLRSLTADEAFDFMDLLNDPVKKKLAAVHLIALSAVDGEGTRLFPTPAEVEQLRRKNIRVFMRLQKALLKLNGFGDTADDVKNA